MSSMLRAPTALAIALLAFQAFPASAQSADGVEWDQARVNLRALPPG